MPKLGPTIPPKGHYNPQSTSVIAKIGACHGPLHGTLNGNNMSHPMPIIGTILWYIKRPHPKHYAPNLGHNMPIQWHIKGEQHVPFHGTFYGHTYCIYSKQWCTQGTIKWESYGPLNGNKMAHPMYHPMDHTPLFPKKISPRYGP